MEGMDSNSVSLHQNLGDRGMEWYYPVDERLEIRNNDDEASP